MATEEKILSKGFSRNDGPDGGRVYDSDEEWVSKSKETLSYPALNLQIFELRRDKEKASNGWPS